MSNTINMGQMKAPQPPEIDRLNCLYLLTTQNGYITIADIVYNEKLHIHKSKKALLKYIKQLYK